MGICISDVPNLPSNTRGEITFLVEHQGGENAPAAYLGKTKDDDKGPPARNKALPRLQARPPRDVGALDLRPQAYLLRLRLRSLLSLFESRRNPQELPVFR